MNQNSGVPFRRVKPGVAPESSRARRRTRRPENSSSSNEKKPSSFKSATADVGIKRKTVDRSDEAPAVSKPSKKKLFERTPYPHLKVVNTRDEERAWFAENNILDEFEEVIQFCDDYRHAYKDLVEFRAEVLCQLIVDQAKSRAEHELQIYERTILGAMRRKFETMHEYGSDPDRYASVKERLSLLMRLIKEQEMDPNARTFRAMAVLGHPPDERALREAVLRLLHKETIGCPADIADAAKAKDLDVTAPIASIPLEMIRDIVNSVNRDMRTEDLLKVGEIWKPLRFPDTDGVDLLALLGKLIMFMGHYDDPDPDPVHGELYFRNTISTHTPAVDSGSKDAVCR